MKRPMGDFIRCLGAAIFYGLCSLMPAMGQQSPQQISPLAAALTALGATNVTAVTSSGTVETTTGSTSDSGTFTSNCNVNGASQLNLQLSSGSRSEVRQITHGTQGGYWTDNQGAQHPMASHNLLTPQPWFCPALVLLQVVTSSPQMRVQFIGNEVKNGANALHFTVTSPVNPNAPSAQAQLLAHLSQVEVFLDSQSMIPIAFDFNMHPDNDSSTDIPIEVQFSNYAEAGGMWFPTTVQYFMNSALFMSLQTQSAAPSSSAR